jgi:hypothetical protein
LAQRHQIARRDLRPPAGIIVVVVVMTCPTCGADPCLNPQLCEQCRKADERTETKLRPELAQILNGVHEFLGRFVIYPSKEAHDAHALWIAHTHLMDAWESTPHCVPVA